jgi:hypothetical protein
LPGQKQVTITHTTTLFTFDLEWKKENEKLESDYHRRIVPVLFNSVERANTQRGT